MPRVRFTVHLLMTAVLLVAVALAGFEAGRRWERTHPVWTFYTPPPFPPQPPPLPVWPTTPPSSPTSAAPPVKSVPITDLSPVEQ